MIPREKKVCLKKEFKDDLKGFTRRMVENGKA